MRGDRTWAHIEDLFPSDLLAPALIFLSALAQMACYPMTVTRAQCRQQVVLSED